MLILDVTVWTENGGPSGPPLRRGFIFKSIVDAKKAPLLASGAFPFSRYLATRGGKMSGRVYGK